MEKIEIKSGKIPANNRVNDRASCDQVRIAQGVHRVVQYLYEYLEPLGVSAEIRGKICIMIARDLMYPSATVNPAHAYINRNMHEIIER